MDYSPESPHVPLIELILQLQEEGLTVGLDLNGALIVQGHTEEQKASPAVYAVMSKPLGPLLAVWLDVERVEAGLPAVTPVREQIPRIAENIDTDDQDLLDILGEVSFFVRGEIAA